MKKTALIERPTLACGHDVDKLAVVTVYPGGRKVYRCSVCAEKKR